MADISTDAQSWSSTPGSNNPGGSTVIGAGLDDNLRAIQAGVKASLEFLNTVAGTNTITASHATLTAYASGLTVKFLPAGANTGATTINISSLGAKNVFANGAACVGGEIQVGIPCELTYDGTQFNIVGSFAKIARTDAANATTGTTTNDSAAAGKIGEYIESIVGPVTAPGSNQWSDATSISLTAGDWDVMEQVYFTANGATVTGVAGGISVTAGNDATGLVRGDSWQDQGPPGAYNTSTITYKRESLSVTTTVYAKYIMTYSVATPQVYVSIKARRRR